MERPDGKQNAEKEADVESARSHNDKSSTHRERISFFRHVIDQGGVTQQLIDWPFEGQGTPESPYLVTWIDDDPRNPMDYPLLLKWALVGVVSIATLAVSFVSSAYSGGATEIMHEFNVSSEVYILGLSLFVLGFAIGPLFWAPLSELYGRQVLFIGTYFMLTAFNAGSAGSNSAATLIVLRFLAGAFGSSPLTNAGGVISDLFDAKLRGVGMTVFASAPFLGPVIGPIVGSFVGETIGWRWIQGIMAIFSGIVLIIGALFLPETYAPVLLRKRAARLSKITGKVYMSRLEVVSGKRKTPAQAFKIALTRPWVLLFREPIVFLLSIYMAIIYGTLYMLFAAFPIVYQEVRGWSPGIGSLSFLGVMVGMILAVAWALWDNKRYRRAQENSGGNATPEDRLPPAMVGAVAIPIGLFWFAWTNYPTISWAPSIIAGAPFGFGMVLVFLAIMNYLIDAYVIYAASTLAASSLLRSLFGAIFPLFTSYMYANLGIHWASSIPAFLALMCTPFPFILYKYGPAIRKRCKYAAEADRFVREMRKKTT